MKKLLLFFLLIHSYQSYANECSPGETMIALCTLPGKTLRVAVFCANKKTDMLYYSFKRKGRVELKIEFSASRKLKRWVDQWTYTTYFGFGQGKYDYVLGVPEEKPGAVAFLNIKKNGESLSLTDCNSNSFGDKDIKSNSIEDVLDATVRDSNFRFP